MTFFPISKRSSWRPPPSIEHLPPSGKFDQHGISLAYIDEGERKVLLKPILEIPIGRVDDENETEPRKKNRAPFPVCGDGHARTGEDKKG